MKYNSNRLHLYGSQAAILAINGVSGRQKQPFNIESKMLAYDQLSNNRKTAQDALAYTGLLL